jgi:hypothetical protein
MEIEDKSFMFQLSTHIHTSVCTYLTSVLWLENKRKSMPKLLENQ